ncbi:MAG: radical SAM protein [Myxococcota bacterium]
MRCFHCNRSCEQAPTGASMTVAQVRAFVDDSLARGKRWERIRVLGGEPTLHPQLHAILAELLRYRAAVPEVVVEIATHGATERARAVLQTLPPGVAVDDSHKVGPEQGAFDAFNRAPADDPRHRRSDFRSGCGVTEHCGIGLGPRGYYPCAVAGGIDRVVGLDRARAALPDDDDDLHDQLAAFCRRCGHFDPEPVAPGRRSRSATWVAAYARWAAELRRR